MTSDLASSLWNDTCREQVDAPELLGEVEADLVVIGGGYTGCSAALHGAREGANVCLIEAGEIGSGGSGRNVGLVNAGLWLPPSDINRLLGDAAGKRLSHILGEAPDLVFNLIDEFDIACEPVRNGTLHCAHAPSGMEDLENRRDQLAGLGAPVRLLSHEEAVARVGSSQVHGALFDPRAGTIQPLAYVRGLARAATQAGARLFQKTPAVSVRRDGARWRVKTPKGSIAARALIIATNAYTQAIEGAKTPQVIPVHYFQAATAPLEKAQLETILPGLEGCWDTALVMSSWRRDDAGRLIIGGMGQLDHIGGSAHRNWLKRKLAALFPELAGTALQQIWFGRIAMTSEHLPKILSIGPDALLCFGYSGRGIGPGTVFGQRMAQALLGKGAEVLPVPIVSDHSLPFAGLRQVYYEAGATLAHFVKDRV